MYRLRHKETKQIATPDELRYLRVNTDGVVERLFQIAAYGKPAENSLFYSIYDEFSIIWQPAPEWEVLLDEVNNG